MKAVLGAITTLLLIMAMPAAAEFYKYRDASGAIRYTDDLTEIPPDQREGIDAYDAVEDYQRPASEPAPEQQNDTAASEEKENQLGESQPQMSAEERQALYQEITQEKEALDAEYAEIQKIKSALDAEKQNIKRASQLRAYNEKALELNTKIEAYDQKRKAYEEKVKTFESENQ